ncbi:hypothetical protein BH11ACT3_BH11ACT3_05560 [soil metagenome]
MPILGARVANTLDRVRPWIRYTLLRVGLFALIFVLLIVLGVEWWISALVATAVAFCVAYIFFRPLRQEFADELAESRAGRGRPADGKPTDEDVEDAGR